MPCRAEASTWFGCESGDPSGSTMCYPLVYQATGEGRSMRRILLGCYSRLFLSCLIVVPLGGYLWLRTSLPQTNGRTQITGLDGQVEIVRDRSGVPHIFATTDHDAFMALGYVHAQDRLWQMEMNRRIGAGRLSELLGDATLDIDKFQRTMGYYRAAEGDYAALSARSRMALDAYAAGVNAWIGEGHTLPPEFLLLGAKPEPWQRGRFARLGKDDVLGPGRRLRYGAAAPAARPGAGAGACRPTAAPLPGRCAQYPAQRGLLHRQRRSPAPRPAASSSITAAAGARSAAITGL